MRRPATGETGIGRKGMKGKPTLVVSSLALTGLFVILSLFPGIVPFQRVLFAFFFIYLVMVPGLLLSSGILPGVSGSLRVLSALVLGTALVFAVLFPLAIMRLDVTLIRFIIPPVVMILAIWHGSRVAENAEQPRGGVPGLVGRESLTGVLILLLVMACACFLIFYGGDPVFLTGDSPDHIAWLSAVSRTGEAFPEQFYYRDGGMLTRDIRKGMMHALCGSINALTGNGDAYPVWPVVSAIGAVSMMLALYCAGLALFDSGFAGLVAVFLFLFVYRGGLGDYHLASAATGYFMGRAYYIAVLMILPVFLRSGDRRLLTILLAASLAATGTHVAHFVTLIFMTSVVSLLFPYLRKRNQPVPGRRLRIFLLPALILAVNLPYLLLRYFRDYSPANPVHTHTQGVMYLTERFFTLNPVIFLQEAGYTGLLALAAIPILWKIAKRDDTLRLLFTLQIAYYILVFTPFLFPLLHEKLSYLLIRMEFVVPSLVVGAFLVKTMWDRLSGGRREIGRPALTAGWLAVILFAILPALFSIRAFAYSPGKYEKLRSFSSLELSDLYGYINDNLEDGKTILSDPITSFSIPAFTRQYVVCPYDQHSSPNDSTAIERLVDCRSVFSPLSPLSLIAGIMKKYGADYILVNARIHPSIGTMYWRAGRGECNALAGRLESAPGAFEKIFDNESVVLFRYDGDRFAQLSSAAPQPPYIGNELTIEELSGSPDSGTTGIAISRFETESPVVKRGERFNAVIYWVLRESVPFGSYVAHIRFDTDFRKNAVYSGWYGKIYRKILEMTKKTRYRFRADHQPFGGIFPPDVWPPAREIADGISIKVPLDAAPGEYTVSVRMAQKPQYPNYYPGDILTDDDYFSGEPVGKIVVE